MAKKENTTSIGFEDAIWRAADKLRGNLNASEYEGVVLGLIFLKYISDKFEAKFKELSEDEYADVEDKDEYEADGVFFVPQDARWSVISQAAHTPQIGKVIDDALEAIERENTKLKGVLPSNYARPELDKRRLGDVVDLFTNIHMLASGDEKDLLGRVYEYCLQKFASMEGKNAGEFYTPSCIVRTIVEILQPYEKNGDGSHDPLSDKQMHMIGHQAICIECTMWREIMPLFIASINQRMKNIEELGIVLIILKDVLFIDSSKHDMIDASTALCPFLSRHVLMLSCLTVQI